MLREKVKLATKDIHKYAENLPIMRKIISAIVTPSEYINYLNQLFSIYKTIEDHPVYKALNWNISLKNQCQLDINHIKKTLTPTTPTFYTLEITDIYVDYLNKIETKEQMIAHAYVRYMADLMGGKIMCSKIRHILPTNVYSTDKAAIKKIVKSINEEINDELLFTTEVHNAFMSYISILSQL